MPSTVTHSYFIMDVYDKLPIKRKIFLKNEQNNLKTFAQSMDVLNFYFSPNLKKGKKVRNFAYYFHTQKTGEYLVTLINYIKYNYYSNNPQVMAFLYGMIAHYILDSTVHPYVYYKTGNFDKKDTTTFKYNGKHHELELMIDKYMIKIRENKLPYKFKHYKHCIKTTDYNNEFIDVLNFSFRETYKINRMDDVLKRSTKNMKLAFKLLRYDPVGIKAKLYKIADFITPKNFLKTKFISYYAMPTTYEFCLNTEHKKWYNPTSKTKKYTYSFIDLYLQALNKTISIIKEIDQYIYNDKKINLEKVIGNLSYKSGIDLNKKQPLKYFEF